jgi:hypothetical protein
MDRDPEIIVSGNVLYDPEVMRELADQIGKLAAWHGANVEVVEPAQAWIEPWKHDPLGLTREDFDRLLRPDDSYASKGMISRSYHIARRWASQHQQLVQTDAGPFIPRGTLVGMVAHIDQRKHIIGAGPVIVDYWRTLLDLSSPDRKARR